MASIASLTSPNTQLTSLKSCPLLSFASPSHLHQPKRTRNGSSSRRTSTVSCNGGSMDRRDLLIGLGGMYGATSGGLAIPGPAFGAPIAPPDLSKCHEASVRTREVGGEAAFRIECCPPYSAKAVDFIPKPPTRIRVRPAVQNATKEQLDKYKEATRLMKALDEDDPRSFMQQANVHCAYCDEAYDQVGIIPAQPIQVHNNWLFFPFHRWYLYFYEKILGKLIGDKDFVMPFWNYDDPAGMMIPEVFADENSPLYDRFRNKAHERPKVIDFNLSSAGLTDQQLIENNLILMYKNMVTDAKKPRLFFGGKYVAGDSPEQDAGSVENVPHNAVHIWVGSEHLAETPFGEDMGNFYSAGRDPIFYCHHMNVDRLWNVWKELSPKNRDPKLPDFLDASFLFYNENAQLVRVKVRDCLDSSLLGYRYESVPLAWLEKRPKPALLRTPPNKRRVIKNPEFPLTLKTAVTTTVKRPKKSRTKKEKEDEEEVVVIEGIDLNRGDFVKFDVFVNSPDNAVTPGNSEFAGSFVNVPHRGGAKGLKTKLTLGLTDLLDDIKADDDDDIVVTIVPKAGVAEIGGVSIQYLGDDI